MTKKPTKEAIERAAKALADLAIESDGGMARVVGRDDNDVPIWALVITLDPDDTREVLEALDAIETRTDRA